MARQTLRCGALLALWTASSALLVLTSAPTFASGAKAPNCLALSVPKGALLTYLALNASNAPTPRTPTWHAATRTSTLPLGTLAVVRCPAGQRLLLGNRTQPTGTWNRTCLKLSSTVALFSPVPPDGLLARCQPAANLSAATIAFPSACSGQYCGANGCCPAGDVCDSKGLDGAGLCCPNGTRPCAGQLCCGDGETCLDSSASSGKWYGSSAKCCTKGSRPCGTAACCNAGEECHASVNQGRGMCCPGGVGSTPCFNAGAELFGDEPWQCCSRTSTCTLSLEHQEVHSVPNADPTQYGRCCVEGTKACGLAECCFPWQQCVTSPEYMYGSHCVLNPAWSHNTTTCLPFDDVCPPENCLNGPSGQPQCGVGARQQCGNITCPGKETSQCFLDAKSGMGLCCAGGDTASFGRAGDWSMCCPHGTVGCRNSCCSPGETCNEVAALLGKPQCCNPGFKPCGSTCCENESTCFPDANGTLGLCCPHGAALGKCDGGGESDCCMHTNATTGTRVRVRSLQPDAGAPCALPCGTNCCRWDLNEECVAGMCVTSCATWGGKRCLGKGGASWCCALDHTCCAADTCCPQGTTCCGSACCSPGENCVLTPQAGRPGDALTVGSCVKPHCPAGHTMCKGGKCCAAGQVCSADKARCCAANDVPCLLSGRVPRVQCGSPNVTGAACALWGESCYLSTDGKAAYCCRDGSVPSHAYASLWDNSGGDAVVCCPQDSTPCGGALCTKDEWCQRWHYMEDEGFEQAHCLPRSYTPCGLNACAPGETCYSSARLGMGLCCAPGQHACRGQDRNGFVDWWRCCAD